MAMEKLSNNINKFIFVEYITISPCACQALNLIQRDHSKIWAKSQNTQFIDAPLSLCRNDLESVIHFFLHSV